MEWDQDIGQNRDKAAKIITGIFSKVIGAAIENQYLIQPNSLKSFYISELDKSFQLNQAFLEAKTEVLGGLPGSEIEKGNQLKSEITRLSKTMFGRSNIVF